MVYGKPPFAHLSMIQKIKCITDVNYQIDFPPTTNLMFKYYNSSQDERMSKQNGDAPVVPVDKSLLKIMKSCLQRNPKERMTIPALLADPFLSDSQESSNDYYFRFCCCCCYYHRYYCFNIIFNIKLSNPFSTSKCEKYLHQYWIA